MTSIKTEPSLALLKPRFHGNGGRVAAEAGAHAPRDGAWVERFTSWGFAVLRLDSLGPRAKTCNSSGDLPSFDRAVDAYSAKEWLSQRPEIDPDRIILAGWSHGGAAVLTALGSPPPLFGARKGTKPFVAGIAFYPDCFTPNEVQAPVLILIGSADTWSPVNLCRQMQEHPKIRLMVYPGPTRVSTSLVRII